MLSGLFSSCGKLELLPSCSAGPSLWQSTGSRPWRLQHLRHMGSVVAALGFWSTGSVVAVHGLSCPSAACGIFLDQESNPRLLHWQVDSLPLSHLGSQYYNDDDAKRGFSFICPFESCFFLFTMHTESHSLSIHFCQCK